MRAKGTAKEWGVKSIKKRREDEHGNIEFLVEWDGDQAETWEPCASDLENAQHKTDSSLASGSRGAPQVPRRRNRTDGEWALVGAKTPLKLLDFLNL